MLKFRLWLTRLFCMFCTVSLHKSSVDFRRSWTLPPVWSSVHRCWQKQTHHAGPARRASLAPSATLNTVQNSNLCIWLCPWALSCLLQQRLHPSLPVAGISGRANLRSAECHDMLVPLTRTQLGRRSFYVAAPTVLNVLPSQFCSSSISRGQFRAGLKTHLFIQAYRRLWELLLKSVLFSFTFTSHLHQIIISIQGH